jgi:hypothetical protein
MLGFREGTPDEPRARTAACFCLEAGADEDLIQGRSPRESAGPRWRGGHCFGRRAPVRPRGSRVPPDAGHLPEFHVTPFRTILGAISRSPIREFPRRYQAPVVRVRREPGPPGHEHGHNNELRSGNKHDPHLPGDPACRARVLAQARQEAPEASCTSRAACQTEGGPQPRPLMYPRSRSPAGRASLFPGPASGTGDFVMIVPAARTGPGGRFPERHRGRGGGRRRPDDSG